MRMKNNHTTIHYYGNLLGLFLVSFILLVAFYEQFMFDTLPCPLCLLQRAAFVAVGLGCLFNLYQAIKPSHYGLMLLSAALGFSMAVRQILLHILPNDPGYGQPLLGLHLYTWSAIGFAVIIVCIGFALIFDKGFSKNPRRGKLSLLAAGLFLLLILLNAIGSFLECGFGQCPDNPTRYLYLHN